MKNKKCFTLAEMLLALAIVGVVAALTISGVIKNYQRHQTVVKIKKFYSEFNKALRMAVMENGRIENWSYGGGTFYSTQSNDNFWSYLKPYISTLRDDCNEKGDCYYNGNSKKLNGQSWNNYNNKQYWRIAILADGSVMWLRTNGEHCQNSDASAGESNVCALVWYDVNGKKPPNTIGIDIFSFLIRPKGMIPNKSVKGDDCNKNDEGWSCATYVLKHGNMDYLD